MMLNYQNKILQYLDNQRICLIIYFRRKSNEVMFQDFKGQGFNLENTHLKDSYKLQKLVYLVAIAYVICVHVGLHYEKYIKKIPIKNQDIDFWNHLIQLFTHLFKVKIMKINKLQNI